MVSRGASVVALADSPGMPGPRLMKRKLPDYDRANRQAAEIVLADRAKYPVGSLLEQWARMILNGGSTAKLKDNAPPLGMRKAK
jgi:hypothetical protein